MDKKTIYYNCSLFDGVSAQIRADCWLEVSDDQISSIGSGQKPVADEAVDLHGKTVIPGLIDAHVHIISPFAGINLNLVDEDWLNDQIRLNLMNCIRCGVITIRDLGASPGLIDKIIHWIEKGEVVGPRIVRSNSFIIPPDATPEHIPTFPSIVEDFFGGQIVERVGSPEEVRVAVKQVVNKGADWIKTTHADKSFRINKPDPPIFSDACFEALLEEAHNNNRPVAMHQTWASGFRKAIELGVDSMEHAPLDPITDDDIRRLIEAGIPIVPTIYVFRSNFLDWVTTWLDASGETYLCQEAFDQTRAVYDLFKAGITPELAKKHTFNDIHLMQQQVPVMMENLKRLHEAGAIIGCGTDSGGAPFAVFGRFFEEIENLTDIGMSTLEALHSATSVNARILGLTNMLGTLEPGKLADFVVIESDPLADISVLRKPKMVVKGGAIVFNEL